MIRKIELSKCNGCASCIEVCPMDVIRLDEYTNLPVIQYPEDCMTCFNCERHCPQQCIDISPFWVPIPPITLEIGGTR